MAIFVRQCLTQIENNNFDDDIIAGQIVSIYSQSDGQIRLCRTDRRRDPPNRVVGIAGNDANNRPPVPVRARTLGDYMDESRGNNGFISPQRTAILSVFTHGEFSTSEYSHNSIAHNREQNIDLIEAVEYATNDLLTVGLDITAGKLMRTENESYIIGSVIEPPSDGFLTFRYIQPQNHFADRKASTCHSCGRENGIIIPVLCPICEQTREVCHFCSNTPCPCQFRNAAESSAPVVKTKYNGGVSALTKNGDIALEL